MCLYKSCYYVGSVAKNEDFFWDILLSLILKDIESKRFCYVLKRCLSNKHTTFSFSFKCTLIFSRRYVSYVTKNKKTQPFMFCLYLVMNDLLFQREKHIKDELFLWFCLGF